MLKFTLYLLLFLAVSLSITALFKTNRSIQKSSDNLINNIKEQPPRKAAPRSPKAKQVSNIETPSNSLICLYASSELERHLRNIEKKDELKNSHFINVANQIKTSVEQNCDISAAKKLMLQYLRSDKALLDFDQLCLGPDFLLSRQQHLQDAPSPERIMAVINETIIRTSRHCLNQRMYEMSGATQRLLDVNGDTIQLKINQRHQFPLTFFINNELINTDYKFQAARSEFIQAGGQAGQIKHLNIKPSYSNGTIAASTNLNLFIETIQ